MSKLKSFSRKLNPQKVWFANQVAEERLKVARQVVLERAQKDAEFAADVLKAVGENLPKEIKEACEKSVEDDKIKKLEEKWAKTGLLDAANTDINPTPSIIVESQKYQPIDLDKEANRVFAEEFKEQKDRENGVTITEEEKKTLEDARASAVPSKVFQLKSDDESFLTEGDLTYKMVPVQTDGGGTILVNETETLDYPRDGENPELKFTAKAEHFDGGKLDMSKLELK